jgi:hypothetical protein
MKKIKQILAITGAVLLVGLYLTTLILAITDSSETMNVFFASVVATVMIPVLIWRMKPEFIRSCVKMS